MKTLNKNSSQIDRINYYQDETKNRIFKNANNYGYRYLINKIKKEWSLYWFEIEHVSLMWIITLQEHFSNIWKEIIRRKILINKIWDELLKVDENSLKRIFNEKFNTNAKFIEFLIYIDNYVLSILNIKYDFYNLLNDNFKKIYNEIIVEEIDEKEKIKEVNKVSETKENIKEKWRRIFQQK